MAHGVCSFGTDPGYGVFMLWLASVLGNLCFWVSNYERLRKLYRVVGKSLFWRWEKPFQRELIHNMKTVVSWPENWTGKQGASVSVLPLSSQEETPYIQASLRQLLSTIVLLSKRKGLKEKRSFKEYIFLPVFMVVWAPGNNIIITIF